MGNEGRFTGKIGKYYVNPKEKVDWVLRCLQSSMMLCWQNRYGDLFMIQTHYFIVFLSQNTFQMVPSLMQNNLRALWLEKYIKCEKGNFYGCEMESG